MNSPGLASVHVLYVCVFVSMPTGVCVSAFSTVFYIVCVHTSSYTMCAGEVETEHIISQALWLKTS